MKVLKKIVDEARAALEVARERRSLRREQAAATRERDSLMAHLRAIKTQNAIMRTLPPAERARYARAHPIAYVTLHKPPK